MSKFGKALKPVNVDQLINFIKEETNPYKPRKTSLKLPEVKPRRKAKKIKVYHKRERNLHGYTVYYDRNRKGWFYRDEEGNRYGIRGSKDKGFSHKKNAIDALQRKWRKDQKKKQPPIDPPMPPEIPDFPDPVPVPPDLDDVLIQYDKECNAVRKAYYGNKAPSDSIYVEMFGGFEEQYPIANLKGMTRGDIEREDASDFSIKALLNYKGLEPIYTESNGIEFITGLSDITLIW